LHVRALKWVVADPRAPEGWRAMMWPDLTKNHLGRAPPANVLPDNWTKWSLDQIEMQLDKPEGRASVPAANREALHSLFGQLEEMAATPQVERQIRHLTIPDHVVVYYKGETIRNEQTLKQQKDNDYTGTISDLKESIRFTVGAEDYYTPYQRITLVPPPVLM